MDRSVYTKPILLGGLIAGMLSGIPLISSFNCCCCMWVIVGGLIASYLLVDAAAAWPGDGDGAVVGAGSGAVAGVIGGMLNYIQFLITGPEKMAEQFRMTMENMPPEAMEAMSRFLEMWEDMGPGFMLAGVLMNVVIYAGVGALGGFIGMRIFRPRKFPPAPPPGYGYPPHGYYGPQGPPPGQGFPPPGQGPPQPPGGARKPPPGSYGDGPEWGGS